VSYQRYVTWAREQRRARKLPGPHGDALQTTATFVNSEGECGASAATIGEIIGYCRQEAQGLLSDLTRMGLLHPPERRGRMTFRRLRMDAPSPDQLQFGSAETTPVARLTVGSRRRQRTGTSVSASEVSVSASEGSTVGSKPTRSFKRTTEEPPSPPRGSRSRDRRDYDRAVRAWSLGLMPGASEEELGAVREALAMVRCRERVDPAAPPVSRREVIDYIAATRPDSAALIVDESQSSVPAVAAGVHSEEEGPRVDHR
jgi:hypothetical protein